MTVVTRVDGDLRVTGNLLVEGSLPAHGKTTHSQQALAVHAIPLTDMRVWDALQTILPAAGANDDLGLVTGTLGTHAPKLSTGDVKAAGCTRYAAFLLALPPEYDDGETLQVRVHAGMETTIADDSATVDVECYKSDRDGTSGADICATAAQSINSLTFSDKDFTITPTGLSAGDLLLIRLAITIVDGSTGTAVIGVIGDVQILADTKV